MRGLRRLQPGPRRLAGQDRRLPQALSLETGLAGKVALVAAASKGLGLAIAEGLAAEGASLAICARGRGRCARRELAALASFLASDQAAYITGQSIAVDGGWIRGLL